MIGTIVRTAALTRRYGRRRMRVTLEIWNAEGERIVHTTIGSAPDDARDDEKTVAAVSTAAAIR